jgi:hypothetical protein
LQNYLAYIKFCPPPGRVQAKLAVYEWLIVTLFVVVLSIICIASFFKESFQRELAVNRLLEGVEIKGEVRLPGVYPLPENGSILALLELAIPTEQADLSKIKFNRKLKEGQVLNIQAKKQIKVFIEGAVERPGIFTLLSGMRYHELVDIINPLPEADLRVLLRRKGYVKADSNLFIPSKKQRKKEKSQNYTLPEIEPI